MFSYSDGANPFSHFPSSFYTPPLPRIGNNTNHIFLHHRQDPLVGHFLPTNASIADTAILPKEDIIDGLNGSNHCLSTFLPTKKPMKKDRHSKIFTSQGLRDRRVRLSIDIAREFFDLQDMLGFDKASHTLEWLFTNSRKAIKKLAQMKHSCNEGAKSFSSTSEYEVESGTNDEADNGGEGGIGLKNKSLVGVSKEKKMNKTAFQLLAKESRAKARARARERTKEKLCTRRLNDSKKCSDTSSHILNQLRSSSQFQACEKSSSYTHNMPSSSKVVAEVEKPCSHPFADFEAPRENTFEESIEIKRKLRPFSAILDFEQNLVISKDVNSNNNSISNNNFPNLPQNWDINSSIARSSFCAITNMNLSTGLQIYGKPWEARNN